MALDTVPVTEVETYITNILPPLADTKNSASDVAAGEIALASRTKYLKGRVDKGPLTLNGTADAGGAQTLTMRTGAQIVTASASALTATSTGFKLTGNLDTDANSDITLGTNNTISLGTTSTWSGKIKAASPTGISIEYATQTGVTRPSQATYTAGWGWDIPGVGATPLSAILSSFATGAVYVSTNLVLAYVFADIDLPDGAAITSVFADFQPASGHDPAIDMGMPAIAYQLVDHVAGTTVQFGPIADAPADVTAYELRHKLAVDIHILGWVFDKSKHTLRVIFVGEGPTNAHGLTGCKLFAIGATYSQSHLPLI